MRVLYFTVFCCIAFAAESLNTPTGISPYSSLNLTSNFNAAVASTTYNWNKNQTGAVQTLTLRVRSLYGGLRHQTVTSSTVPYSLTYAGTGGTTVTISTTDQTIGTRSLSKNANANAETANSSINYTGTASNLLYQGTYSDTLTYTYIVQGGGTYTGTLVLTSSAVPASLAFSITPDSVASSLPLTTTQSDLLVGTAYETSNSTTGYTVSVSSSNGSFFKNSAAGGAPAANEKINYTAKYGATNLTLTPANTNWTIKTVSAGIYNNSSNNITISYTAPTASSMRAGNYSDTLTFTIAAQ